MILCFLFLLSIAFYFNIRTSKVTFGFWSKYMSNARRYNYFSDIQTKREYAYERRIYHTSQAMDCRFSQAFDEAWHANRKNGLLRFRGQAVVEGIALSISIFTMFYFARPEALLTFPIGAYAAITDLVSRLLNAASECPESIFSLREFNALKQELDDFLKLEPTEYRTSPVKSGDCSNLGDELIVFNNVSFSYPASNDLRVISNFTYSFKKRFALRPCWCKWCRKNHYCKIDFAALRSDGRHYHFHRDIQDGYISRLSNLSYYCTRISING